MSLEVDGGSVDFCCVVLVQHCEYWKMIIYCDVAEALWVEGNGV